MSSAHDQLMLGYISFVASQQGDGQSSDLASLLSKNAQDYSRNMCVS